MTVSLVYAHPYHARSRANAALLAAVDGLPGVEVRRLYDLYPDYDIDAATEQRALEAASTVVLQGPLYWYMPSPMLVLWIDTVFAPGWAYAGGSALAGKSLLWAVTTGGGDHDYRPGGKHERPFADFTLALRQTARYCGMTFLEPFVVLASHRLEPGALDAAAQAYRARLESLRGER